MNTLFYQFVPRYECGESAEQIAADLGVSVDYLIARYKSAFGLRGQTPPPPGWNKHFWEASNAALTR